jgi:hypothetical protein
VLVTSESEGGANVRMAVTGPTLDNRSLPTKTDFSNKKTRKVGTCASPALLLQEAEQPRDRTLHCADTVAEHVQAAHVQRQCLFGWNSMQQVRMRGGSRSKAFRRFSRRSITMGGCTMGHCHRHLQTSRQLRVGIIVRLACPALDNKVL